MQPNFSEDSRQYADRLPAGFPCLNNPFRMLIDEAGFVPIGLHLYVTRRIARTLEVLERGAAG